MRQLPLLAAFAFTPLISFAAPALVPLPASLAEKSGPGFELTATTGFTATGPAAQEAGFVAERLRASTGFALPVSASGAGIVFRLDPTLKTKLGDEGYRLESDAEGVRISAADTAGLFYGGQTLLELLPPEAFSSALVAGKKWTVPALTIEDEPRFAWRGFMLDESRHFIGASHVKRLLDAMALHKLNRFHWHLTDDEGWRIEIKAYPKLTDIGAWRGTECRLPNTLGEKYKRYGGFYTQDELRDIVAYAKARHIEIMPEVDLPGHSLATVTAYPELLAGGKSDTVSAQGFTSNVISPAKPATYRFVETVFDELKGIFPYEYIHIGGDEVNHGAWKDSPEISALMKAEKLQSLHDVQVFFTKRLEGIFARRGKKIFGWNEVFDERLDKNTGIMAWTGTGPGYHAAKKGYPVVMAPGQHAYLDMGYPGAQGEPPSHWWAGPVDNARVYAFDPLGDGGDLPQSAKGRILGVEAALWTEYVVPWKGEALDLETFSAHADYKTWPRLSALAEVGWTPQALRVYDDFEKRLGPDQLRRLGLLGVRYRIPTPPSATVKAGVVTIREPFPHAEIRYTLDGTLPGADSLRYEGSFDLKGHEPGRLRARTFLDGRAGTVLAGASPASIGEWSPKSVKKEYSSIEYNLTGMLDSDGIWRATFEKTGGRNDMLVRRAELLVAGVPVAVDAHAGRAGGDNRGRTYRFVVPVFAKDAKVTLRVELAGDNGVDSNGRVTLNKSIRLEPETTVETRLAGYASDTPAMAGDWDDSTRFWIASVPGKNDTVTWRFASPVAAKSAALLTGERNGTRDQAVGAKLEYSEDGVTWKSLSDFAYGAAYGELPAATKLRALRLRFTAKQPGWVIVNDPVLK